MVEILKDEVTQADIEEWYRLKDELGKLKSKEALLRSRIFKSKFPDPKEGTNRVDLGGGYSLKATHEINRKVDPGELQALGEAMTKGEAPPLPLDKLIKWVPELAIKEYRTLTDNEKGIFDKCLIIKPGSAQLEIDQPKKGGKS